MAPRKGEPRLTQEELQERYEFTAKLLSRRLYKSDIKRVLAQKYNASPRTCETYIARAREIIIKMTMIPKEEHRVNSLAFWEGIIASDADLSYRMRAQERIEKLLGLEAPQQFEVSSTVQRAIEQQTDLDLARELIEIREDKQVAGQDEEDEDQQEGEGGQEGTAASEPGPEAS